MTIRRQQWVATCFLLIGSMALAQPPERGDGPGPRRAGGGRQRGAGDVTQFLARLMALDANGDGSLSFDEVQDARLRPLLTRADANSDKSVTREELTAWYERESASQGNGDDGPGAPNGPGDFGPPRARGAGNGPQPGQLLPGFMREALKLSAEQTRRLDALQKQVDEQLKEILTDDQRQQLQQMSRRGPGREGGPDRAGGPPREEGSGRPPRPNDGE